MLLLLAPSPEAPSPSPRATDAMDRAVSAHDADPTNTDGRGLAELAFRFAPAEVQAPRVPQPGALWTLAETLAEIQRRGARLVHTSRGLRLRHAHRMIDLARNVAHHERALAVWVQLRDQAPLAPFDAPSWDPAVRLHAAWFALAFEMPPTPFAIRPGETVVDASLLRAGIAGRLAAGPEAPSAPRLRADLAALFERYAPVVQTHHQPEAPLRRAA